MNVKQQFPVVIHLLYDCITVNWFRVHVAKRMHIMKYLVVKNGEALIPSSPLEQMVMKCKVKPARSQR